jgi:hypothetical protein
MPKDRWFQAPATNLDDTYNSCDPEEALKPGDPRYVDLNDVRCGDKLPTVLKRNISRESDKGGFLRQLISGHRGSGKSTELYCLADSLVSKGYFAVYVDIQNFLDIGQITYLDILVTIARAVELELRKKGIPLEPKLLDAIERWFDEKVIEEERKKHYDLAVHGEATLGGSIPLLGKMLASMTSDFKSGSTYRETYRRKLENQLSTFLFHLNALLTGARMGLREKGFQDMVVILDGIEKMVYREEPGGNNHQTLFIHHCDQLKAPQCHLVYTVPIALAFSANLGDAFPDAPFIIPMVRYMRPEGKERLKDVLKKRIDVDSVFSSPDLLDPLVDASGGALRDLMRLIRNSCNKDQGKIEPHEVDRAILSLTREYDRLIQDEDIEDLYYIFVEKRVTSEARFARLLRLRLVHEFENHDRWADLHPAVLKIDWVRRKFEECKSKEERKEKPAGS